MTRKCGSCRECCIVLEVEPVSSPRDTPCKHLCEKGCGIYSDRPESCKTFTCAWLEGMMALNDQPNRTHMVIWCSKLIGVGSQQLTVIQCNVARGAKRHKKTMRWLMSVSYQMPVLVVESDRNEMFIEGESILKWLERDFIRFDYTGNRITGGKVIPEQEVLHDDESRQKWKHAQMSSIEVHETKPEFSKQQKQRIDHLT